MKTKYTVSKTGWSVEGESHEDMAIMGAISKEHIAKLLDGNLFFANKKEAGHMGGIDSPIKRNVKITVVITDVVAKEKKKK